LRGWFLGGFLLRMSIAAAAMFAVGGLASAQSPFPSRPVHIFVPYPAGGGVDILARTLGDVVSRQWGQSVVVENRPGAGGLVASQALVTSAPDGYTLIVVASGHATNPFLYPKIPYDTFKGFHADIAIGLIRQYPPGARRFSVQDARRYDRAGTGEAGQPVLWPCG
jgi:tripartite-type tricarboxylate transporter receptor subunit TctC